MADALFYCSLLQIRSFYLGYPTATANADSIANSFSKMSACPFSALNITVIFICLFSRKRGNGKRSLLRRLCCQKRNLELLRLYIIGCNKKNLFSHYRLKSFTAKQSISTAIVSIQNKKRRTYKCAVFILISYLLCRIKPERIQVAFFHFDTQNDRFAL